MPGFFAEVLAIAAPLHAIDDVAVRYGTVPCGSVPCCGVHPCVVCERLIADAALKVSMAVLDKFHRGVERARAGSCSGTFRRIFGASNDWDRATPA
jgi:hypothetical protein